MADTKLPLLLLPGLMCDDRVFAPQCAAFADGRPVIVADYGEARSLEEMAQRALAGAPSRFALAGHSMGGRVALEVFRAARERVERLALFSTGVHGVKPGEAEKRYALLAKGRAEGIDALLDDWLPPMVGPKRRADARFMASVREMCRAGGVDRFEAQIEALLSRPEVEDLLPEIDRPTLIGGGDRDEWSPVAQHEAIAATISGSDLVVFENCGHMCTLEAPDAVNAALAHWLGPKA